MSKTMAEVLARALYVAAHWQDTISEPDGQGKPQSEYERRAGERWDTGKAGWANYQRYPRYAEAGTAALSAAGFGLVADAKAEAMEEAGALIASEMEHQWRRSSQQLPGAQIVAQRMQVILRIIRARAAALRGDS